MNEDETVEESAEETNQNKRAEESLEDRKARLERQLSQTNKKLGINDSKPTRKSSKSDDLGLGEKAFLIANGIKGSSENNLVKEIMAETGKSLEDVIETGYFQSQLRSLREVNKSTDATIKGKRSSGTGQDAVEYWIAKGELPPASEVQLRRDVVNARLKTNNNKGVFYNS
jgi:hypothetical protein